MTTNNTLKAIQAKHGLSARQIAELVHVQPHTVRSWRVNPDNVSFRVMPESKLELLLFKLGSM